MEDLAKRFNAAMEVALRKDADKGVGLVAVSTAHEAELILELVQITAGELGDLLRQRIYAIVLLQSARYPDGRLHIKRGGGDWEALTQLPPPAVLLVPTGIREKVISSPEIQWGSIARDVHDGNRSSLGCLSIIALLILVPLGLRYAKDYWGERSVRKRAELPPHIITIDRMNQIPRGEPRVSGESVIVEGYLYEWSQRVVGPGGVESPVATGRYYISAGRTGTVEVPVDIRRCEHGESKNCLGLVSVFDDAGRQIHIGSKVRVEGTRSVYRNANGNEVRFEVSKIQ